MLSSLNKLALSAAKITTSVAKTYKLYNLNTYSNVVGGPLAVILTFANNKNFSLDIEQVLSDTLEVGNDTFTSTKQLYNFLISTYDEYYPTKPALLNNVKESLNKIDTYYNAIHSNDSIIGYCNEIQIAEC